MTSKLPRMTSDDDRLELKAATRRALGLAGRANAFALVTRVEPAALSKYGSPSEDLSFLPIDVLLDLEREIGAPILTEALAAMQGYRLVPINPQDKTPVGLGDVADLSRESADVVQSMANALADGQIDGAEKRELTQQIAENIVVLRRIERKVAGGAG